VNFSKAGLLNLSFHRTHYATNQFRWLPRLAVLLAFFAGNNALRAASDLRGSLGIHDPSAVIQGNGRYYVFGTGQGIISKSSADKIYWVTGPSVFASPPSWTTSAVPAFTNDWSAAYHFQMMRTMTTASFTACVKMAQPLSTPRWLATHSHQPPTKRFSTCNCLEG
jgi:hypothetical protein